ncbi:nuclear transport factor 2 family protein [Streptomyces sp. A7024]|uniref:Nuclear transport factor 2 family protein n=1 Tax=Streptomyces coryli TaxID=1128680 RepID=A0A6G4TXI4_9ACTN|nr:nuclear transport factor 2 family protein [Streptomyces coryli]NGN64156.1 nuclear transport factor 2 family protein [Streptomyces coryli]
MKPLAQSTPEQFIADFFATLHQEVVVGDHDPAPALARFYAPDIVMVSDGIHLDWDRLVAHIRPVRRNLVADGEPRFEVHEAIADGDRIAARLTIHATTRKKRISTECIGFYDFLPDGRLHRSCGFTRTIKGD